MQDRPIDEPEGTGIHEDDFIEINLSDLQVDAALPRNATQAFQSCMQQFVINSIVRDYEPPKSLPKTVIHGLFCDKGEFSAKQSTKTVLSAGIAGAASLFAIKPSKDAVSILAQLITNNPYATFVGQEAVVALAQFGNMTRTIILLNYMSRNMFDKYFNATPDSAAYLKVETPRRPGTIRIPKTLLENISEKSQLGGRKIFDLASAAGANFPVLFSLLSSSPAMAFTSFFAFLPLSLFGMDNLKLLPDKKYPARTVEVNYMREQLHTFLLLPRAKQLAIMDKIQMLEESQHPNKDKAIFGALLNLARPDNSMEEMELIKILQEHVSKWYEKPVTYGVATLSSYSQLPFTAAAGLSIARLFADPNSAEAIATGVLCSMLAFLPTVGLGFKGGRKVGAELFVEHPTLGMTVNPELRDTLKWLVLGINLLAGGTSVTFTYYASSDLANLLRLSEEATRILQCCAIGAAYTGSTITFGQYFVDAMDELTVFFAKHNATEETRRLMSFITGYSQLINVMESMNAENYCDITANWKLAGNSEMSKTLHAIFSAQLSDNDYRKLQQDLTAAHDVEHGLEDSHTVVLPDRMVADTYIVAPSFLDQHPGLRRRRPVRDVRGEASDDIEMQFSQGRKIQ